MNIHLIQSSLHWHAQERNRNAFEEHFATLTEAADLIVLPEMFTTGFTNAVETMSEEMDGPTVQWMRAHAAAMDAVLCGSIIIRDVGGFYNRLLWVRPDGTMSHYDKRHLFGLGGEGDEFAAGKDRVIVESKGFRFCLQVCYDLRFPVFSRNKMTEGVADYDCLLYVANWPSPRANAWRDLLRARAIENQCYVIGVNRVGKDEKGLNYDGDSAVIDFKGHEMVSGGQGVGPLTATLERAAMDEFRKRYPFLNDGDHFSISD